MTAEVKMYYQQGNNPLILAKRDGCRKAEDIVKISLDRCNLFQSERSLSPLREKIVETPRLGKGTFTTTFNGKDLETRKSITRRQIGTNNTTRLCDIDFPHDFSLDRYSTVQGKAVSLTRDLPGGDVFELVMKEADDGIGKVLKFGTKNGAEQDLVGLSKVLKKLDPLAKKWIKTAFKYMV